MKKVLVVVLFFLLVPFLVGAQGGGLVQCGGRGEPACTLCDFWQFMHDLFRDLLLTNIYIYLAMIPLIAGIYFFFNRGDLEMVKRGRAVLKWFLIGLLVLYGAWASVNFALTITGVAKWDGFGRGWWIIDCRPYEYYSPEIKEKEEEEEEEIEILTYDLSRTIVFEYNPETGEQELTYADSELPESIYQEYFIGTKESNEQTFTVQANNTYVSYCHPIRRRFGRGGSYFVCNRQHRYWLYVIISVKNNTDSVKNYQATLYRENGAVAGARPTGGWLTLGADEIGTMSFEQIPALSTGSSYRIIIEEQLAGVVLDQTNPMPPRQDIYDPNPPGVRN